jgi:hypothetical protein
MAQSLFQDLPQAQGYWTTNVSKMAVLFGQWMEGNISPTLSPGGMTIPQNDEQVISYVSSTNNISNIVYKEAGVVVATQTFEYRNLGVADDDDIVRITLT